MARWPPLFDEIGETRWGFRFRFVASKLSLSFLSLFVFIPESSFDLNCPLPMVFFVYLDGFANLRTAVPNFNLVNRQSLDKILKAEVFVHTDGQLRAAHLILDYIPISKSFQVPKCVIKAKDPQLQRISVAAPGFLITGPILEGTLASEPIPEGIPKVASPFRQQTRAATSS